MMGQIEAADPKQIVYVSNNTSWLAQPNSDKKIFDWWPKYWEKHYQLLRTMPTKQGADEFSAKEPAPAGSSGNFLLLLQRKE
jgi:hypothetical protein